MLYNCIKDTVLECRYKMETHLGEHVDLGNLTMKYTYTSQVF